MNQTSGSPTTVLILDDDVAFILWLGELFTENGCQAFPAMNSRQAFVLARKLLQPIDMLLVNPNLPGAKRTVQALSRSYPNLRTLFIQEPPEINRTPHVAAPFTLERPHGFEQISRTQWRMKIRKLLMRAATERLTRTSLY